MPVTKPARTVLASLGAVTLLVSLAACAPAAPEPSPSPEPTPTAAWVDVCATTTGAAVESVTVTSDYLTQPTVEFEPGLTAQNTQRLVLGSGDETTVEENSLISVAYSIFAGSTGEQIETQGYGELGPVPLTASTDRLMPGLLKTLGCVNTGTRVVSTIAPSDAFGETGFGNDPDEGETPTVVIAPNETLVVVMDVVRILDRAWGDDEPATEGMPDVTLIAEGQPVVTIPDTAPPAELQLAVLKRGDGPKVDPRSTVLVQYVGVSWDTGEVFDSSWSRGQPSEFSIDPNSEQTVIPGFAQAIAEQTLGSQVIVVIPPELGYGTDPDHISGLGGQTLVFVVDILFAAVTG